MNNPRRIQRHLVKALAAGALLAAAALPLAIATTAGAVTAPTLTAISFTPHGATTNSTGTNATGTATFTGSGFANNGATNDTLVATCTAGTLVFTSVAETSATTGTADFAATGAAGGTCSAVLTDANGPSAALASAATLDAAPVITSISPNSIWEGTAATTVTITGTGFATGATVSFANGVDGTSLTSSITSVSATSIVLSVTPTNPANSAAATSGAFNVVVSNTDGGTSNTGTFTVGNGLENVTPSATAATGSIAVALLGSGFEYGATVSLTSTDNAACFTEITNTATETVNGVTVTHALATSAITSPTTGTATIVVTSIATPEACGLTVTNGTGAGNNTFVTNLAGAFGVDVASTVAPLISSVSPTTPLTVGGTAVTETLTGSGFSSFSILGANPLDIVYTAGNGAGGTTFTFNAAATTGVTAGAFPVTVTTLAGAPTTFTPAITVAGPAIVSQAPNLVVGAAFGTSVVFTGTGFTNTTTGTVTAGGTGLAGTVSYTSATTETLVVTGSPTSTTGATVQLSDVTATGTVLSPAFAITIDAAPTVTGPVTYATGAPSDVGVGATATTVYIHGTGFLTGATVTAFVNGASVADANVTATVTAVTSTQITATVAIKAPDTNTAVGYTVTNTDGGAVKVAAFAYPIFIGAGPTITGVTPTTGTAGATTSFAVAGTGFEAGAVVSLSPANGTCGTATVSASTTLAASCTLGTPGVTPTYLVVTNPDGGSATSTTAVLPAQVVARPFHVSAVHGAAVAGRTVTITISGTGFYGQPKVTATGYKFGVTGDSGSLLTIRVTAKKGLHGEHDLTVRLANGKSGKAGFNTKS
jgi:IPT/TIG domain